MSSEKIVKESLLMNEKNKLFKPIFIVGYRRSGTTLLRNILNGHSELAIVSESHFIAYFYDNIDLYGDLNDDSNLETLLTDIISTKRYKGRQLSTIVNRELISRMDRRNLGSVLEVLYDQYKKKNNANVWGDKTPYFLYRIPMLIDLFPNCRIIHIIRDPRAALLSQQKKFAEFNVIKYARKWINGIESFEKAKMILEVNQYFEIKYEDLVSNPVISLQNICDFLLISYESSMLNFYKNQIMDVNHATSELFQKPITDAHIHIWQQELKESEIQKIEAEAFGYLKKFGYQALYDRSYNRNCYIYNIRCYLKEKCNPYNLKLLVYNKLWVYMSRVGVFLSKFGQTKNFGLYFLRLRIRFAVFDNPRKP